MTSVDESASAVSANAEQARELATEIAASKDGIDSLATMLATAGVQDLATEANNIAQDTESLTGQANGLADSLDNLRQRLEALKGLLTSRGGATATRKPEPAATPFHPRKRNRKHEDEIRKLGWPKNTEGRTSARGKLYGLNGASLDNRVWRANPEVSHKDLKEPWASSPQHVSRWHVEGQVTAWMREKRVKEAVLYLNLPACGKTKQDPGTCDKSIAAMLPEGYSLVVWTIPENGSPYSVRYRGTGEAVK